MAARLVEAREQCTQSAEAGETALTTFWFREAKKIEAAMQNAFGGGQSQLRMGNRSAEPDPSNNTFLNPPVSFPPPSPNFREVTRSDAEQILGEAGNKHGMCTSL